MIYWLLQIVFGIRTDLLAIQSWANNIALWSLAHKMKINNQFSSMIVRDRDNKYKTNGP